MCKRLLQLPHVKQDFSHGVFSRLKVSRASQFLGQAQKLFGGNARSRRLAPDHVKSDQSAKGIEKLPLVPCLPAQIGGLREGLSCFRGSVAPNRHEGAAQGDLCNLASC
jgi:hypothetical protein